MERSGMNALKRVVMWIRGEREYTVTYYAIGMMSNRYIAGTYTFTANGKEIKELGSVSNVGFNKNYRKLIKHYPADRKTINYISTCAT